VQERGLLLRGIAKTVNRRTTAARRLVSEPETERTTSPASNEAGDGFGRAQDDPAGFQPYWGKPAYEMNRGGGGNVDTT